MMHTVLRSPTWVHLAKGEEQCHVAVHSLALQLLAGLHASPGGGQLDVHTVRLNACSIAASGIRSRRYMTVLVGQHP
jgi:hypothetical protein